MAKAGRKLTPAQRRVALKNLEKARAARRRNARGKPRRNPVLAAHARDASRRKRRRTAQKSAGTGKRATYTVVKKTTVRRNPTHGVRARNPMGGGEILPAVVGVAAATIPSAAVAVLSRFPAVAKYDRSMYRVPFTAALGIAGFFLLRKRAPGAATGMLLGGLSGAAAEGVDVLRRRGMIGTMSGAVGALGDGEVTESQLLGSGDYPTRAQIMGFVRGFDPELGNEMAANLDQFSDDELAAVMVRDDDGELVFDYDALFLPADETGALYGGTGALYEAASELYDDAGELYGDTGDVYVGAPYEWDPYKI